MRLGALLLALPFFAGCMTRVVYVGPGGAPRPDGLLAALEQTPCFGTCPVYLAELSESGHVHYEGRAHTQYVGTRSERVAPRTVELIEEAIARADVLSLADRYEQHSISDLPTTITTVRGPDGQLKQIHRYHGDRSAPSRLIRLEQDIARLLELDARIEPTLRLVWIDGGEPCPAWRGPPPGHGGAHPALGPRPMTPLPSQPQPAPRPAPAELPAYRAARPWQPARAPQVEVRTPAPIARATPRPTPPAVTVAPKPPGPTLAVPVKAQEPAKKKLEVKPLPNKTLDKGPLMARPAP